MFWNKGWKLSRRQRTGRENVSFIKFHQNFFSWWWSWSQLLSWSLRPEWWGFITSPLPNFFTNSWALLLVDFPVSKISARIRVNSTKYPHPHLCLFLWADLMWGQSRNGLSGYWYTFWNPKGSVILLSPPSYWWPSHLVWSPDYISSPLFFFLVALLTSSPHFFLIC